jgi:hypothetical protein
MWDQLRSTTGLVIIALPCRVLELIGERQSAWRRLQTAPAPRRIPSLATCARSSRKRSGAGVQAADWNGVIQVESIQGKAGVQEGVQNVFLKQET